MCPYYNIGYCKYKNKCSKEHAKVECLEQKCPKKKCKKDTENLKDMEQNADSKVRLHVNLSMKLNHIVTMKNESNLLLKLNL